MHPGPDLLFCLAAPHMWFVGFIPGPEILPRASTVGAQSPNHWATKEFPLFLILRSFQFFIVSMMLGAGVNLTLHFEIFNKMLGWEAF